MDPWGTMVPRLPLLKYKVFQENRLLTEGKQSRKAVLFHQTFTSHRVKGLSSPHQGSCPDGHPHSSLVLGLRTLQAFENKFTLRLLPSVLETNSGLPKGESARTSEDFYLTFSIHATSLSPVVDHHDPEARISRPDVILAAASVSPEVGAIQSLLSDHVSDGQAGVCQTPGLSWQSLTEPRFLESLLEIVVSLPAFLLLSFRGTPMKHGGCRGTSR